MAYTKLLCCFSLYCLSFGSHSKHHNQCNIHLKSESITGQLALKLVIMTNYFGSSWTFVFVLRMKEFANAILEHIHRTLKASEQFTSNFSVVSLYIACLLALVASTTTAATFT